MRTATLRLAIVAAFIACALGIGFSAHGGTPEAAAVEFFENKVRPIFVEHCYPCHSQESGKNKGSLFLDTKESVLKGGDSGPALVAGDPEKSLLIKAVRYTDKNLQMPPKGKKLAAEQIAALEEWVRMGAPDPRVGGNVPDPNSIAAKTKSHWAFRPVSNPPVPKIAAKNERWVKTPVDAFILSKLDEKGLRPSAPADKRTLIRRAYFDLTGLPPSNEEVEAFVADKSKDAFTKVVDRLLSSPRYGERWGRHWLDVARYADTKGYLAGNQERRFPFSWTYRDWVIRAFNEDLPYDQFLIQQIAADQLELGDDKRALAAMGFLTLGRRFLNNKHDIIDDRIDVVTRGTMALTVSCARCHDHKYDPVSAKDYYSLYGVFDSSHEPEDRPLLGMSPPQKAHEEYLAEKKRREEALEEFKKKKSQEVMSASRSKAGEYLLAALETARLTDKAKSETLARERKLDPLLVERWMKSLESWNTPTNPVFYALNAFAGISTNEFTNHAAAVTASLSTRTNSGDNPLIRDAFTNGVPPSLKDVTERYGKVFASIREEWHALLAANGKTNASVMPTALPDAQREQIRQMLYGESSPYNLSAGEIERLFDVPSIERTRELRRQIDELDAIHPGAPPRAMALVDNSTPSNPYVFVRGNPGNRGPSVPRQFLEVLAGESRKPFEKGSGRLELANAIASKDNPLTARVMVNRIWQQHFGRGFVTTASDFGLRSDPPSHPELLDWLSWQFMENGWSIKKLHRVIMLSSVYQQSSVDNPHASKVDPNNALLWKMNRRRLEFEALRDSLLAASQKIDFTMGGQPVDLVAEPFTGRRSVYGYIDRQNLPGVFRTFDFANPDTTSAQRFFTTVPQQALFMLNSPFVVTQARNLLTNTECSKLESTRDKVRFLYEQLYQREPEREEIKLAEQFVKVQSTNGPMPENKSPWRYGYGAFDPATKRVAQFTALPHYTGNSWQNSAEFPDSKTSYLMLNREGGHPGNRVHHSAVRRWVAPFDGKIAIDGELFHFNTGGDGVLGRIVSSRDGELGHWIAFNNRKQTVVTCEVRKGDTIDFVTEPQASPSHDTFKWAPVIKVAEVKYGTPPPAKTDWHATRDFDGPPKDHRPLTAWEKYAQTLLLANEFIFVD